VIAVQTGKRRASLIHMDEKNFKKHLAALAHGHHHPEEHDWSPDTTDSAAAVKPAGLKKRAPAKRTPAKKARKKS